MTGGFDLARQVNRNLAAAAQRLEFSYGRRLPAGCHRRAISCRFFRGSGCSPGHSVALNLGAVQLNYGYTIDHCRRAVEMIGADGLILHLNVLQEAVQPEGNRNFKSLGEKIADVCRKLELPL